VNDHELEKGGKEGVEIIELGRDFVFGIHEF